MGRVVFSREVLITLIVVATIVIAILGMSDPSYITRLGALVSAFGAILVIIQVFWEIRNDEKRESEKTNLTRLEPQNREHAERLLETHLKDSKIQRLKIVLCVAIVVVVGEILSGWGDRLLAWTFD